MVRHCDCGSKLHPRNKSGVCIKCQPRIDKKNHYDDGGGYRWGHMNTTAIGGLDVLRLTPMSELAYLGGGMGKYK